MTALNDTWLTVRQVATQLAVSTDMVRRWVASGQLPAVLVSHSHVAGRRSYRIAQADLATFVTSRRVRPPAPRPARRKAHYTRIV